MIQPSETKNEYQANLPKGSDAKLEGLFRKDGSQLQ